jgi:hypothetical protein
MELEEKEREMRTAEGETRERQLMEQSNREQGWIQFKAQARRCDRGRTPRAREYIENEDENRLAEHIRTWVDDAREKMTQ